MEPDSASYLGFSATRSAGYPLFLEWVGFDSLMLVQSGLAALALGFLGYETSRLTSKLSAGAAVTVAIALCQPIWRYHHTVLTESLFMTLAMVIAALMMRAARQPDRLLAILSAGTIAGIAIAVRPAGWFLLPMLVLFVISVPGWRRRWAALLAVSASLLLVLGAFWTWSYSQHSDVAASQLSRHLFAKAALLDAPDETAEATAPARALTTSFGPVRDVIRHATDGSTARFLTLNYEVCIQYACSASLGIDVTSADAAAAAGSRILSNPVGFAHLTWLHYRSFWTVYDASHPLTPPRIEAFVAAHRPLPFEPWVPALTERIQPRPIAWIAQPAILIAGLVTFGLAVSGLCGAAFRVVTDPGLAAATALALGVHGGALLVALTGVGIERYLLALWPLIVASLVTATAWALSTLIKVSRDRRQLV